MEIDGNMGNFYFLIGSLFAILTPSAILTIIYLLKCYRRKKFVVDQMEQIDRVHAAMERFSEIHFDCPPAYAEVTDNTLPSYCDLFSNHINNTQMYSNDIIQNKV